MPSHRGDPSAHESGVGPGAMQGLSADATSPHRGPPAVRPTGARGRLLSAGPGTCIANNDLFKVMGGGASLTAQLVKNLPALQETPVQFLGSEDPLEKGKAPHSSILAWRIPWTIRPWVAHTEQLSLSLSIRFHSTIKSYNTKEICRKYLGRHKQGCFQRFIKP